MTKAIKDTNTGLGWNIIIMEQLEADDVALLSSHWNQLQRKLDQINQLYGDKTGLRINIGKTKSGHVNANNRPFIIEAEEIEEFDNLHTLVPT